MPSVIQWDGTSGDPFKEWKRAILDTGAERTDESGSSVADVFTGADMGGTAVGAPALRRGRRSGAEGRAPGSGAGGPPVGRGGRRGAAGPAQRWEGPRRGRPGPVHRGGAAGCGAARSVCRPPRSRSPSPGSAGPKSIRFGCVWLCLQSVCAFPSQNVAFGSHLHPQSHSIRLRGESV